MQTRIFVILVVLFLAASPVFAQGGGGYPLPENLPPITPENAAQLTELARISGTLPGEIAWSPDGSILAVGTSQDLRLYDANDLAAPPRIIDGGPDVIFSPSENILLSGEHLWDAATGEMLAEVGPTISASRRGFSLDGSVAFIVSREENETGHETVVHLWAVLGGTITPLPTLHTGLDWTFSGLVFSPDESVVAVKLILGNILAYQPPVIQLWNIAEGRQIAALEHNFDSFGRVIFSPTGQGWSRKPLAMPL